MKLFNTLTMQKEEFVPLVPGKVGMYSCGPTVYNYIHIGNARPMIMFDALRRYFEYRGYTVTYVQNFTDIDDKIISAANGEGVSCAAHAERFIAEYFTDARGLGVRDATVHPRATENVAEIIDLISALVGKGHAYASGGDVYFRADSFEGYGKLSHQPRDALLAGARVDASEAKESAADFALWKAAKPGEPLWESPWGAGRPGWHIECSAMSCKYLGRTFDIHCGGQDLIFPHHENEIAQSEGASGQPFARYWIHNGYVNIDNRKMSKSLGNFFTVREAASEYGYGCIRMLMLMSHYRSPLNYSVDTLPQARSALERLETARENYAFLAKHGVGGGMSESERARARALGAYRDRFIGALDDDFNTADAMAVLFELVREGNTAAVAGEAVSSEFAGALLALFDELEGVFGVVSRNETAGNREIESLIAARQEARAAKDWARADNIRDKLKKMGVAIEDTPLGVKWKLAP
ncbi:MAG: cysteine--tRNA ligase [Oscillospiraceae bacterium]|jgi:cysteinyl-tRNA synthetase|nr:cysteine--tRNA ligase [Oscillospiraceae bacterium]